MGRTGHHDDWLPQFWSFTKYKNHTTNANNEKRKVNLEEDLLAGVVLTQEGQNEAKDQTV